MHILGGMEGLTRCMCQGSRGLEGGMLGSHEGGVTRG